MWTMRNRRIAALQLGIALFVGQGEQAVRTPAAVIEDSAADKKFPAVLVPVTIPNHGIEMDGTFYLAPGSGPHGTVLLLHGLPGYESNSDLAQSIRRAGWNVLVFNYRGTWGTAGAFSFSSAIDDVTAAVEFLRSPTNVARYRLDMRRLVVIGHSVGGFLAGYEASHDRGVGAVAMLAAANLGTFNRDPEQKILRLKRWESQLHPVRGATASGLFAEGARHAKDWNYVHWAAALASRPILIVEASDQNHADLEMLASALRMHHALLEQHDLASDHSFSDHRIELQSIVVEWLQKLGPRL